MNEQFEKLKAQLELQEWPSVYLFKFIAPNQSEIVARVSALFEDGTDLQYYPSRNGNYISISAKEMMLDVESIMEKYLKAAEIKGVISL